MSWNGLEDFLKIVVKRENGGVIRVCVIEESWNNRTEFSCCPCLMERDSSHGKI